MKMLKDLLKEPLAPWQNGSGDVSDIVLDSRIRVSRNLMSSRRKRQTKNWQLSWQKANGICRL